MSLHPLHDLVVRLRRGEYAEADFGVAADRCEELGFAQLAAALRAPNECFDRRQAVWTLSVMVGVESTIFNRYDVIAALPAVAVAGCEVDTIDVVPARRRFRLRRLVLAPTCREDVFVSRLQISGRDVLENEDPVPAALFSENGFDTFDVIVNVDDAIAVMVENHRSSDTVIAGCLLGSAL